MTKKTRKTNGPAVCEDDVSNYLDQYLVSLETKIKDNKFAATDVKLAYAIIKKFKTLFCMWDESSVLERFIDKELFIDVYSTMANTFIQDSNEGSVCSTDSFLFECKHCGEEIILRNNNCKYSYQFHKASPEHLEFMRNLNRNNKKTERPNKNIDTEQSSDVNIDETKDLCESSNDLKDNQRSLEMENIANPRKIKLKNNPILMSSYDVNFIGFRDKKIICELCAKKLSSTMDTVKHMNGNAHRRKRHLMKLNENYCDFSFGTAALCLLCNSTHTRLHAFVDHCKSYQHQVQFQRWGCNQLETDQLWKDHMVDLSWEQFHCKMCEISLIGTDEIFKHFKSVH